MAELSLSKQAALLSATESFRFLVKSGIGIVLARVLSTADYGTYRQLFLIYTAFSTVLLLGIPQSMLYFLPKKQDATEQKKLISRTVDLISVLAILFCLAIMLFRAPISRAFSNPQLANLLFVFSIYPIFMFVGQIYSSVMMGLKKPQRVVKFTLFSIVMDSLLILASALFLRRLDYIVLALLGSALAQWIYVRIKLRQDTAPYSWDPAPYKELFKYSLPLGLSSIIGILAIQLDKFVISAYFSPAEYAIFAVGAMELPFIGILVNSVNSVMLPALSSNSERSVVYDLLRGSIRKNALIIFPVAVLFFILAGDLISFLYTGRYSSAAPYFRIYLIALFVRIASYGIIFQALNKTKFILINAVFTLVLNLALNLLLVNTALKMVGPALATVIVTYASATLYLYWLHSKLHFNLLNCFPLVQLGKTIGAALVAGLAGHFSLGLVEPQVLRLALGAVVFTIAYLPLAYLVGALLPYDLQNLYGSIKGLVKRFSA